MVPAADTPVRFASLLQNLVLQFDWRRYLQFVFLFVLVLMAAVAEVASIGSVIPFMGILVNPEFFNGPKNKFITENDSEYHPLNISKYPEHIKFMNKFLSKSSLFHQGIENKLGVKNQKKLEISNYITEVLKKDINDNTISQLKKLNELFKAGVLNKEEFEKAKKKILD